MKKTLEKLMVAETKANDSLNTGKCVPTSAQLEYFWDIRVYTLTALLLLPHWKMASDIKTLTFGKRDGIFSAGNFPIPVYHAVPYALFFRLNCLIIKTIKSHDGKTLIRRHSFSHRQALNYARKGSRYFIDEYSHTANFYNKGKLQLIKLSLQNLALLVQDAK